MSTEERLPTPPYVGFRTFMNFLDWLREVGIPSRIDRSFWGERLSGATGSQVLGALRFFGLVNKNGVPDSMLERMASNADDRKIALRALMQRYEAALNGLDLERATAGELDDRFRRYGLSSHTFRKAVVFFIQAAQYCGMPLSPYITRRRRAAKANGGVAQPRRRGRPPKVQVESPKGETPDAGITQDIDRLGLHPSVAALLDDLNRIGAKWDQAERDRWMGTFVAVIDYAYPTNPATGEGEEV